MENNTSGHEKVIPTLANPIKTQITYSTIPHIAYPRMTQTSPSLTSWSSLSPQQNYSQKIIIERPLLPDSSKLNIPPSQPIQSSIRHDYDSTQHIYPYLHSLNHSNYPSFNSIALQNSNAYRLFQRLPYHRSYVNGCGSYPQSSQTHPLIERVKLFSNNQLPQMNKISSQNSDHNYAGLLDWSNEKNSSSIYSQNLSLLSHKKRNLSVTNIDSALSLKEVDKEPAPKKKKNYHPSREAIKKAISQGFIREVNKIKSENGEIKRNVVYTAPDGTILSKKQDIKVYLMSHPELELKNENFSFDTRFSLNPKKPREIILKPTDPLIEISKSLTDPQLSKNKPKLKNLSESNLGSPSKISQKKVNPKNRKIISKYFKKLSEDTKYYEGLSPGSYRKKIPSFQKVSLLFPINISHEESWSIFQDMLTVYEFLHNFSLKFNIKTGFGTLKDIVCILFINNLKESKFIMLLSELLAVAISSDNFSSEVNSQYHMDNIQAFEWNWLIIHEIFKLYVINKEKVFAISLPLQESIYYKNLKLIISSLSNQEYIYNFSLPLKAFSLRFIVDQITASNTFSAILNDHVETVARNRRDKFHFDTRIRQLRTKIGTSAGNGNKSIENEKISNEENNITEVENERSNEGFDSMTKEMGQLELERDKCRDEINKNMAAIRAYNLGSDRYDREYVFVESQAAIFIEGLSNQVGIAQKKFPFISSSLKKPQNIELKSSEQLLCISNQLLEKITFDSCNFNFDYFDANIICQNENKTMNGNNSDEVSPFYDSQDPLLNVLINYPKMIRQVCEDDYDQLIDIFSRNFSKHLKMSVNPCENGNGWWYISDQTAVNELTKCLNQKGLKEQNLHKSLNRTSEFISWPVQDQESLSFTIKIEPIISISMSDIIKNGNSLIVNEINQLSIKMDEYLQKISIESIKSFEEMMKEYLKEPGVNIKEVFRQMIDFFLEKSDKKFDRVWYNKWVESFESCSTIADLYILFLSFKIKLDPNSKICKICQTVNENLTVCECGTCQFSAHESCLKSPMKKNKKSKLICSKCLNDSIKKMSKICKKCFIKSGKTINCSGCKDYFHSKCASKSKSEQYICDSCNPDKKPTESSRVYIPPNISFEDAPFNKNMEICQNMFEKLRENKDAYPFLEPVDPSVPNYYQIIKNPMNFKTVGNKIKLNRYKTITQFYNDIIQIFENCYIFNDDKSKIAKCGLRLQKYFEEEWKLVCQEFE